MEIEKIKLDELSKENVDEVYKTLDEIEKGNMQIVKQEHQLQGLQFADGPHYFGEKYIIEMVYTCKMCKDRKNNIGICKTDDKYHDQICEHFIRG